MKCHVSGREGKLNQAKGHVSEASLLDLLLLPMGLIASRLSAFETSEFRRAGLSLAGAPPFLVGVFHGHQKETLIWKLPKRWAQSPVLLNLGFTQVALSFWFNRLTEP